MIRGRKEGDRGGGRSEELMEGEKDVEREARGKRKEEG